MTDFALKAKRTKGEPAPTKALLAYFDAHHTARFHTKAVIQGGKDATLLANLWRQRQGDPITVEMLIDAFFESTNPYVERRGFTVPTFLGEVGALLIRVSRSQRLAQTEIDWRAECQVLHQGRCKNRYTHGQFMKPEKP